MIVIDVRRQPGDKSRNKKRNELFRLEQEVQELEKVVAQGRTAQLCLQSTGAYDLQRHDQQLLHAMASTSARTIEVQRTLKELLDGNDATTEDIMGLTSECLVRCRSCRVTCYHSHAEAALAQRLRRRMSELRGQAAWHGACLLYTSPSPRDS